MRVLIILNNAGTPGGHVVQATRTADALGALGIDVTLATSAWESFRDYQVVHAFGIPHDFLRAARQAGAAVVVSPIWCSAEYHYTRGPRAPRLHDRLALTARLSVSVGRRGVHETARRLRQPLETAALAFEAADLLLPNSRPEADQLRADLGISTPMHVVPNAADHQLFTPPDASTVRSGVAYVGRIEPHKNQLGLIDALRGTGIPLTIAGPDHPDHGKYAERCRAIADESVTFHPGGDARIVRDVYRAAAVHALPSWFETTGLVSLEAAATGCAVVTTSRGYAREYFDDLAIYCDPGTKGSILRAVQAGLATGAPPDLRRRIVENYTWEHTARATLAGYELALRH